MELRIYQEGNFTPKCFFCMISREHEIRIRSWLCVNAPCFQIICSLIHNKREANRSVTFLNHLVKHTNFRIFLEILSAVTESWNIRGFIKKKSLWSPRHAALTSLPVWFVTPRWSLLLTQAATWSALSSSCSRERWMVEMMVHIVIVSLGLLQKNVHHFFTGTDFWAFSAPIPPK